MKMIFDGAEVAAATGVEGSKETPPHAALFHNNHDGTFTDVAEKAAQLPIHAVGELARFADCSKHLPVAPEPVVPAQSTTESRR
jgi:hypothetical protein